MESFEDAVVVPLVPLETEPSAETMLRMLLNREALLINRVSTPTTIKASGMVAQSTGAFAKAISDAVSHAGRTASASSDLYRVILPTGSATRDLVPAVGGGYRGLVRATGSTKFAGQVRLVPAAAGAGATLAAGPLIATVGLAVAGEMLAQHQMNKKLDAISNAIAGIQLHIDAQERSILTTAAKQAEKVAAYLLDQAKIPSISSAPHAFGELDNLTNTYIDRLDRWLNIAADFRDADRVNAPALMKALVGSRESQSQHFEHMVAQTYEALALRARVVVLEKVASEFANKDRSLPHVQNVLREELSALADRQFQLVALLDELNILRLDAMRGPVVTAGKKTLETRTSFARLAKALHSMPDSIPMLTEADETVLELAPSQDGFKVMSPS